MSVQDDKAADQEDDDKAADHEDKDKAADEGEQRLTEKPEPGEDAKKKAAEMMEAYKEKPTIVLPGTGGSISGTAVNEWLDEDGNPKKQTPDGGDTEGKAQSGEGREEQENDGGRDEQESDGGRNEQEIQDQIEKDKALNDELRKAAEAENKGEED